MSQSISLSVGQAAFLSTTAFAASTIASSCFAAFATTTISTVAFAAIALVSVSFMIGSSVAYFNPGFDETFERPDTAKKYFERIFPATGYVLAGLTQFIAVNIFTAIVEGISRAIGDTIYEKIRGRHSS